MRRSILGIGALIIVGVVLVVAYLSIYVIDPTKQALVLRFGQTINVTTEPGLYFKLPLIDNVVLIEKRILDVDSPPFEVTVRSEPGQATTSQLQQTEVGQRLVVDAFARYRIEDPLLFYQAAGSIGVANQRLQTVLNSAVRRVLGEATLFQLVRDQRAQLMTRITTQVDNEARAFGVRVVDVRIRRADLPEANSQAIFDRMRTERVREATQIRSDGDRLALGITSSADAEATVIIANANRDAENLRGFGDAEANRIFAAAYSLDPDFFAFYRSMQAYQLGLQSNSTTLVLSPDSDFFRFFGDIAGGPFSGEDALAVTPATPVEDLLPLLENLTPVIPEPLLPEIPAADVPVAPAAEPAPAPSADPAAPAGQ